MVIESGDWPTRCEITSAAVFEAVLVAVQKFPTSAGFAPMFGRCLPVLFRAEGLIDVGCEARRRMVPGAPPEMELFTLTIERAQAAMVTAGLISDKQVAAALSLCADPSFAAMSPAPAST